MTTADRPRPATRVSVRANGPYIISGPVDLVDPQGHVQHVPEGQKVALCRCGASRIKPFCDATHNACGFRHDAPAPPRP